MSNRSLLQVGDRIRLLSVPACDLAQRKRDKLTDAAMPGWTADTIERIIASNPIVVIDKIDENGAPWFDVELPGDDGTEYHSLMILDDDSWEPCQ
jgi:hypothetical protein